MQRSPSHHRPVKISKFGDVSEKPISTRRAFLPLQKQRRTTDNRPINNLTKFIIGPRHRTRKASRVVNKTRRCGAQRIKSHHWSSMSFGSKSSGPALGLFVPRQSDDDRQPTMVMMTMMKSLLLLLLATAVSAKITGRIEACSG